MEHFSAVFKLDFTEETRTQLQEEEAVVSSFLILATPMVSTLKQKPLEIITQLGRCRVYHLYEVRRSNVKVGVSLHSSECQSSNLVVISKIRQNKFLQRFLSATFPKQNSVLSVHRCTACMLNIALDDVMNCDKRNWQNASSQYV